MLPGWSFLLMTLLTGAFVCAVIGLVREIRGVRVDSTRPPGRVERALAALRSPAVSGRLAAAVLVACGVLILTRWPVAAVGIGLLVAAWPRMFGGARAEQRQIAHLESLVVWTESLRDTIAAHSSLEQAIPASTANAPVLLRPALVRLVGHLRARVPMDRALLGLAAELDDPSADMVIAALVLNVRRRGDRLADVLTGLSTAAREELEMRRKVSAGRVEVRRGVQVVIAITLGMALFLAVFSRSYIAPYGTPAGQIALACVVGIFAAGFFWLRKLSGQDPVAPFLSRPGSVVDADQAHMVRTLIGAEPTPGNSRS